MSIFPYGNPSAFSCLQKNDNCGTDATCEDFKQAGWPGAFYIFAALNNFNKFLNQFEEDLGYMRDDLTNGIGVLLEGLGIKDALKVDEKMNFFQMASSVIGLGSGFVGNPFASQAMSTASSLIDIANEHLSEKDEARSLDSVRADLEAMVKDTMNVYRDWIARMRLDVYGYDGGDMTRIPRAMRPLAGTPPPIIETLPDQGPLETTEVAQVFETGAWLLRHPTENLFNRFESFRKMLHRALGFRLLRTVYTATVVISTSEGSSEKCQWSKNSHWFEEAKECWILVKLNKDGRLFDEDRAFSEANFLWEKWEMDKGTIFGNAISCWMSEPQAEIKTAEITQDPLRPEYPACLFSIDVKKGSWVDDRTDNNKEYGLDVAQDFPQYPAKAIQDRPVLGYVEWPWMYLGYPLEQKLEQKLGLEQGV